MEYVNNLGVDKFIDRTDVKSMDVHRFIDLHKFGLFRDMFMPCWL